LTLTCCTVATTVRLPAAEPDADAILTPLLALTKVDAGQVNLLPSLGSASQKKDAWNEAKGVALYSRMLISKVGLLMALLAFAACSARDPEPSPLFDGRYVGTRRSDRLDACGIDKPEGRTSARVAQGHLTMLLFGPRTQLIGTVGEDGRVRASGIWPNPTGGFPGITVLEGSISNEELAGTASDFRCHTVLQLHKSVRPVPRARAERSP
jgi:hypothetical protein